jgi:replicative DNA helicase
MMMSGFRPGLFLLGGRPAMGKSALAAQIARHVALRGQKRVHYFSLDRSAHELTLCMIASEAWLDVASLRRGFIQRHEWMPLAVASGALAEAPLVTHDGPCFTLDDIRREAGLVVIDSLQHIARGKRQVAQICLDLKEIALERAVPILLLSQLSRAPERRCDPRPVLTDLQGKSGLEHAADVVMLLYRDEYYKRYDTPKENLGIAELFFAKNNFGSTGALALRFLQSSLRFTEVRAPEEEEFFADDDEREEPAALWSPPPEEPER